MVVAEDAETFQVGWARCRATSSMRIRRGIEETHLLGHHIGVDEVSMFFV